MRIALVEPYYGGSHRAWADGYAAHSTHEVVRITHPARFWKWRMHGAHISLARALAAEVDRTGPPDVVLASSLLDVAAFAGAVSNVIPGVPIAVYFHESQFTYPWSPADRPDFTYAMKNWSAAATADLVIFNSEFHRDVFRTEAEAMLNGFPDAKQVELVAPILDSASVIPVGVDAAALVGAVRTPQEPPLVVWNHRWEHDKGPDELRAVVSALLDTGSDFAMAMCGEVFVSVPAVYEEVVDLLGSRLVHRGWMNRPDYLRLLSTGSVALSTARQEFFGVGVVEAIAAGAHPVLPNRLVYPERVAALGADPTESLFEDPDHAAALITEALRRPVSEAVRSATLRYDWSTVAPTLDEALARLAPSSPESRASSPE